MTGKAMVETTGTRRPALSERAMISMAFGFSKVANRVESVEELDQMMADRLDEIGIPNFILYQVVDRNRRPTAALKCGRSNAEWRDYYMANGLAERDEVLLAGTASRDFFTWGQRRLKGPKTPLTPDPNFIFREALNFDLVDGFYMPIENSEDRSTFAVSMMAKTELPTDDWMSSSLYLMASHYMLNVLRITDGGTTLRIDSDPAPPKLTGRQLDCLRWVRLGKTDWEIGQILGISQHTVIEHLEEARGRLGVRTRTQAVIEAHVLGVLDKKKQ